MSGTKARYALDEALIDRVLWPVANTLSKRAPWAKDLFFGRGITGLHRRVFTASKGRFGQRLLGMQVVMLTTTGRKTGQPRRKMMTAPVYTEDTILVVGSYGGDERTPAWVLNLQANPDVTITAEGRTRPMRARLATADERVTYWPDVVKLYPAWEKFQELTTREIPFIVLQPVGAPEHAT